MAGAGSGNHRSRSAAADPGSRVARWFIFKPKIPICAYFVGPWYWYFYNHSEYFTAIWKIVWQFGIFCGNLYIFSRFGMFGPSKIWQPCLVLGEAERDGVRVEVVVVWRQQRRRTEDSSAKTVVDFPNLFV
jgi:hypothetical protein